MHKLAQGVLDYARKRYLLRPGDRVGIALSGGADSVALLRLMLELGHEAGLVLSVVHINHKLRGTQSDADEAFVRELAQAHGMQLTSESHDTTAYAARLGSGLEAAARELRYEFFRRLLRVDLDRIATAHTLDDQAETLLLKLARGAGTRGLAGIYPQLSIQHSAIGTQPPNAVTGILHQSQWRTTNDRQPTTKSIIRPLLATRRQDLRSYLADLGQAWREDSSNRDLRHTRNRVRHGILPRFEKYVNPHICGTLADTAEIARAEEEYWAEQIARWQPQVWRSGQLDCQTLTGLPLALRRRLVRGAADSLSVGLEFRHVEEILCLEAGRSASLPEGWLATRQGDHISFHKRIEEFSGYEYLLPVPGKVSVPESHLAVEALLVTNGDGAGDLLESSFAKRELVVRNWRPGERFWPAHVKEPRKIKELLQDRHIAGDEKKTWPVIASADEVVWMRGFGVRRDFRAKHNTGILIRDSAPDTD